MYRTDHSEFSREEEKRAQNRRNRLRGLYLDAAHPRVWEIPLKELVVYSIGNTGTKILTS